ncbi:MAG: hypothetical protein JO115_11840 [Pseudonocardiales bacterium]|nr:hypothetical protein [Pseudonocardiales bacterium]
MGLRVRALRCWRGLSLSEAAGLAGLSFTFWGEIERIALKLREPGQALQAATTVHPQLLPGKVRQAEFWAVVGRALVAGKETREQGVHMLVRAEQLAPQRIRHDRFVRETVVGLLRQTRRDAGGRELRGLAWRLGVAPLG